MLFLLYSQLLWPGVNPSSSILWPQSSRKSLQEARALTKVTPPHCQGSGAKVPGCSARQVYASLTHPQNPQTGVTGTVRAEGEPTDGSSYLHDTTRFKPSKYQGCLLDHFMFFQSLMNTTPPLPGTFVQPFLLLQLIQVKNKQHFTDREHLGDTA